MTEDKLPGNIIFFDSDCLLCEKIVKLLLKMDKKEVLLFASFSSIASSAILTNRNYGNSVLYWEGNNLSAKGDAVIRILRSLGYPYKIIARILSVIPRNLLNMMYDFVARNRFKFFGKRDVCYIPSRKDAWRFLK